MVDGLRKENIATLDLAIDAGLAWLDDDQNDQGFWAGMLESNCCMEAEWIMAFHVLEVDFPDIDRLVSGILSKQRRDGAWETYYDATSGDINTTVEAYVALRVAGVSPLTDEMCAAREWILAQGGLGNVRVFTRYWLAILGEWPWSTTPNVPPEIIRLPNWFPFNIYHFASWARATLLPVSILSATQYTRPLAKDRRPDELFPDGRGNFDYSLPRHGGYWSWESFFYGADRVLHMLQRARLIPGRKAAIKRCLEWIIRHQDSDGAWGGIQPPWIYSLMALRACGYPTDHPVLTKGLSALQGHWSYERDDHLFLQASESPVWDTLLSILAMQDCGRDGCSDPSMIAATDWILTKESHSRGDWSVLMPHAKPGGWPFERANHYYPDIDDSAMAILVLSRLRNSSQADRISAPLERAIDWVLTMQSDNGGWGAFDRNNDTEIITKIPFCDFGEVLDPPSADVTAHVVEGLMAAGLTRNSPAICRAINFLWQEQENAGCWFGRWGVNYIYGTAAVLPALAAAQEDMSQERVARAVDWLLSKQNKDGGWGETCASYMDLSLAGTGVSTASQTAWAMIALLAVANEQCRGAIETGIQYLLEQQCDGTWNERCYTGAGFPGYGFGTRLAGPDEKLSERFQQGPELARAFMINYNMYRHYFPLIALGRARAWLRPTQTETGH
jgi:squalene-hopene/tetraprenyl-beta-curcumene cyclase